MAHVRLHWLVLTSCLAAFCGMLPKVCAQDEPESQPPTTAPSDREAVFARVIEVHGDVQHAPLGTKDWEPCKLDDEYPQRTKLRTGVRSSVKLQIGTEQPYTAVVIDSVSLTVLSEAYKTKDTKRIRIGVGYGKIRAGVAEGGLKSDFTVDSPVATLSKRGTWNFGLSYERGTDRFEIFLLDRGLVDALNKITGERRGLLPGQLVTQAMRSWADEAQIRRNVSIVDVLGQEDMEVAFNRLKQDGLGVLGPGGGRGALLNLSNSFSQRQFADLVRQNLPAVSLPPSPGRLRAEGFFGTGRGEQLIQVIIEHDNPLAQKGFARPGTYRFRRSALDGWLRKYGGGR